ncbi:MAG: 3-methyl-2-oxobutanoate hydroxymethyltransferase [Gammaproteobacteria bacterium]|nr:3-methyl-2-oxobutanoate hydroxymethyltransferase [Gammaproteobacteria bacterium]
MQPAITLQGLRALKHAGGKIVALTAYDATFARLLSENGVEIVLVGDSLGMVLHGAANTLAVTMDDMVYHTRLVAGGASGSLIVSDMPFMSYATPDQALVNAARLIANGAHMVKPEGGSWLCDTVAKLSERGIPVCAHLGLTPQSVNKFGGHRIQGREPEAAEMIFSDAQALEAAGAELLVLECVPSALAGRVRAAVSMPVIGIGAGPDCDGQVLVLHDLIGVSMRTPRMAKNFLQQGGSIQQAVRDYVQAVKSGTFPEPMHGSDH